MYLYGTNSSILCHGCHRVCRFQPSATTTLTPLSRNSQETKNVQASLDVLQAVQPPRIGATCARPNFAPISPRPAGSSALLSGSGSGFGLGFVASPRAPVLFVSDDHLNRSASTSRGESPEDSPRLLLRLLLLLPLSRCDISRLDALGGQAEDRRKQQASSARAGCTIAPTTAVTADGSTIISDVYYDSVLAQGLHGISFTADHAQTGVFLFFCSTAVGKKGNVMHTLYCCSSF